jgi:hypothetical protein
MPESGRSPSCRHCGEEISATHLRTWPDYQFHVTCATKPMVDDVCPFAGNESMCGKHATAPARVQS